MRIVGVFVVLCLAVGNSAAAQDGGMSDPDPWGAVHPSVLPVDVPALIHVRTAADVARVRRELIAFIWKNGGDLPGSFHLTRADSSLPPPLATHKATSETLAIDLPSGFKSIVYHIRPDRPNGRLAIFHQGHAELWAGGLTEAVSFFLDKGYAVLAIQMPLMGDNKRFAPAGLVTHDDMPRLASADLEPIRLFVEPVAASLNYALRMFRYDDVVMIGVSGGAWTTTLYSAIDPRVRVSIPVAGSLPDYLRVGRPTDKGDFEQYHAPLYKIANYLDLYVLGSSGCGRRQRQILNKYDSCCFAGIGYRTYDQHVAKAVASAGAGAFDAYLDESHRMHVISQDALARAIVPLLETSAVSMPSRRCQAAEGKTLRVIRGGLLGRR